MLHAYKINKINRSSISFFGVNFLFRFLLLTRVMSRVFMLSRERNRRLEVSKLISPLRIQSTNQLGPTAKPSLVWSFCQRSHS